MPYRAENRIEGIVLTFVDITARKDSESRVREAKDYAETILEALPEPLLVLSSDLTVKSANATFYNQFQMAPGRTEGRRIYELQNGCWDIPALRKLLQEDLTDDGVVNGLQIEHEFEKLGRRVLLLNARRVSHMGLILLGLHDITERSEAEAALRRSEERLQRMVNIDGVGVLTFDAAGTVLEANDAALKLIGYTREDIENGKLNWRSLTPEEYVPLSQQELAKLEQTGRIGPYEKEYLRKDGSRSWMVFAGADLGDGTLVEYCIDISARKQAEAALHEADQRKDEFLATLAHELRNPLAPISSGLQVLRISKQGRPEEFEEIVSLMERQTRHLVRLVDDLLDISRITRGKLDLRRCIVPLDEVIRSAVEVSRPLIDDAAHELQVSLPEESIYLDADPHRLAQVISNLLNNAARYTPDGGRIRLTAQRQDGELLLCVEDNGIGIEAAHLESVFEMFGQVQNFQASKSTGLGIGLTLVKSLVEMHGGRISVESEGADRGSRFEARLPIIVEPPVEELTSEEEGMVVSSARRRVLVVDDNRTALKMLSRVIKMLGHISKINPTAPRGVARNDCPHSPDRESIG